MLGAIKVARYGFIFIVMANIEAMLCHTYLKSVFGFSYILFAATAACNNINNVKCVTVVSPVELVCSMTSS
jgi:hypothetical protein